MKQGLTFISERTGQLRYSDIATEEQWVQQTSTYIPIQAIKRGQPVSVATKEDLEIVANGDEAMYEALLNSSDSYIVLTNPSRHTNTIGLALEYTDGYHEIVDGELKTAPKIHIINNGKYIEDANYYAQAFTEEDTYTVAGDADSEFEEYWPPFFDDYENSIGKKIYVKGSADGELTLVKEEAYLAHNNVIVLGFVTDAKLKDRENEKEVGAIEVQVQGDDRGLIDATIFEAVVGEDFVVGDTKVQANGETNCKTKVFALGAEDDEIFKFSFNINQLVNTSMPKGFIALQRIDGKTYIIYTNGEISEELLNSGEAYDYNDRAFYQVAKYYAANYDESIEKVDIAVSEASDANLITKLQAELKNAMAFVSQGENVSLKDGHTSNITDLNFDESELGTKHRLICMANDIGGYFDVYVSSNLTGILSDLNIESHGAFYNRGYAVLADIRNPKRQNIIGIYNSGHVGLVKKGENAIFLKQGLFRDDSNPFEEGERYYLGSHGNIFKVPQEYYNSIISIGYAQYKDALIVDCCDARQYNNGDLPVGYMKPSIKGEAEFGFLLMNGQPVEYEGHELLYKRLKNWYDEADLQRGSYNFGAGEDEVWKDGFIIPKVQYQKHTGEEESYTPAQIKWLAEGVYKEMPRTPFVRRFVDIEYPKDDNGIVLTHQARIPDIDITPLMIYGPEEDRLQIPDLENLDIKFFADLSDNNVPEWTQIDPGFHSVDAFTYFGYKWTVTQTVQPSDSNPYGTWVLRAAYNGTQGPEEVDNDDTALGICYQADPFSPPRSLAGRRARIFVVKHDYYSRQFDVEALFKDYVKESLVDATDQPWVSHAISGNAVRQDLYRRVYTKDLLLGSTEKRADINGYIQSIKLNGEVLENEDDLASYTLNTNLRLKNPAAANDAFLDYYNGILKYYYQNETEDSAISHKASLQSSILNEPYALLPSYMFKAHKELLIKNAAEGDFTNNPHGIVNDGYEGNLNAKTLQSANLGYPQHILANNVVEDLNNTYVEKENAAIAITIPYTQKTTSGDYRTRLGNLTEYRDADGNLIKHTIKTYGNTSELVEDIDIRRNYDYVQKISGNVGNDPSNNKQMLIKYLFSSNDYDISFEDENENPLTLRGDFVQVSSIKKKYVLSRFESKNSPAIGSEYSDKYVGDEEPTLNEALQAIYEMPLATFKYNREYLADDSEWYKRYFGIIVERIAATKENFASDAELTNKTALDEVEYTYTDEEKASIAEYLKLVTDNPEQGMRESTVIGILLKAAKETQERLLNLEVSTYGKDSPTLPGEDEKNPNFTANDQKSTIAGLNRLVKALCREVFQNADPTNINELGGWSEDGENYSRLDLIDKEVNGEAAKDDNQTRIFLTEGMGTTYPDVADISETAVPNEALVPDAENDNDFGSEVAVKYPTNTTYTPNPVEIDDFDGINDAINRIVAKLNQLTININGEDDIKKNPKKLDYIRGTLATLLRDVYSDGSIADVENGIYVKKGLSRIDKILQDLYNFDLTYGATRAKVNTYNGKDLYGVENNESASTEMIDSFSSRSPEKIEDIFGKASILDVIIELLSGNENNLVKTKLTPWKDLANNENNWKVNADNTVSTTYDNTAELTNNKNSRNHYTVLKRLDDIEKALTLMFSRIANKTDFTTDTPRVGEGAYSGVTSIDDYMRFLRGNSGLCFHGTGLYADKVENDERTTAAKAITAEDWVRPVHDTISDLDAYDAIYDAIKRIKNSEMNLGYNNAKLGTDYDTYKNSNARITKDAYETLAPNGEVPTPEYTVTSDMRAVLKLLYGSDLVNADDSDNKTGSVHFNVADEREDNFKNSPNGVSVIDALYKMLYNVPKAYRLNVGEGTAAPLTGTVDAIYNGVNGYDPANPKAHIAVAEGDSPVADGHRNDFILQAGTTRKRLNRIDILEDWVKAIYNYIGFGNNDDSNYFTGNLHLTFEDIDDSEEKDVYVNGKKYCTTAYSKDYIQNSGTYTLVEIALQSYYNTLKLEKVLGDDPNGYPVEWNYVIPAQSEGHHITSKVETNPEAVKAEGVHAALNKLYSYINKLDVAAIDIDERLRTLKADEEQYKTTTNNDLRSIHNEIGTKSADSSITSDKLWEAIEETNVANRLVDDVDASLQVAGNETVVKNDATEQSDNDVVTPAAMKAYVADMMAQLRNEYEAKCQQVKEQAIILAYLKCSNITVVSPNAIKIDHNGVGQDYIWRVGHTANVGSLEIESAINVRFGQNMRKIRIIDNEDNITYEAWFECVDESDTPSSTYKQDFFEDTTTSANDMSAFYDDTATKANDISTYYDDTTAVANNMTMSLDDTTSKANEMTKYLDDAATSVNDMTTSNDEEAGNTDVDEPIPDQEQIGTGD